ncbi:hypothetical protein [Dyadobacter diqingensis]|uniref:hypothetical protein n=1 Tax=Dyadobacter diqingensis TaxID=2938121 RepID=UPI0020C1AB6E|nr:hypothetical protein [Dyadobacter diqingensis]
MESRLRVNWIAPVGYFIIWFFIGIFIVKDYGVTWDEPIMRQLGLVGLKYVNNILGQPFTIPISNQIEDFSTFINHEYGSLFEIILAGAELAFIKPIVYEYLDMDGSAYYLRHIITWLVFWLSAIFFYKLVQLRVKSIVIALLGTSIYLLSPRIFADSFYNSKDIIFLAFFVINTYTLSLLFSKFTFKHAFFHGMSTGFLISIRLMGIISVALSLAFIAAYLLFTIKKPAIKTSLLVVGAYLLSASVFIYLLWPFLWESPFSRFFEALRLMAHFVRQDSPMLYRGEFINRDQIPWHYVPVWLLITIPPFYLFLGFIAGAVTLFSFGKEFIRRNFAAIPFIDLYVIASLILPIASIIFLQSIIYDGWRHLFYLHAFISYLATLGGYFIVKAVSEKYALYAKLAWAAVLLFYVGIIIKMHPQQQVYFSMFNKHPQTAYELDYWGHSYKESLEWLCKNSDKDTIKIAYIRIGNQPMTMNKRLLPPKERNRIVFKKSLKESDYYITNYKFGDHDILTGKHIDITDSLDKEIYNIAPMGYKINTVFSVKK